MGEKFKYYIIYFVSANDTRGSGIGRCFTNMGQPIETEDDILAVQHRLEKDLQFGQNEITLLDWKRIH